MHKGLSRKLSKAADKNLSKWDEAISEAKRKIKTLRQSIRTFETLRDNGVQFPESEQSRKAEQSGAENHAA
jgi:hypothetical protein